jgi:serine phosphatase RsbU (regulator of sigma subunit)
VSRRRQDVAVKRPASIRRSLLASVAALIVLLGGTIMATTFLGERHVVRTLSRALIARSLEQTVERLHGFFDPVERGLLLLRAWIASDLVDPEDPTALNRLLVPLMRRYPQASSLLVADARGREHMLIRSDDRWRSRQARRDQWGTETRWLEWTDATPTPTVSWRTIDYDPRQRPWYQGALAQRARARADGRPGETRLIHWTPPYPFFTTRDPGMTASVVTRRSTGVEYVVGFDVLLNDVSRFTTDLHVSDRGTVVVLTEDDRVIGLPSDARFATPEARKAAFLRKPAELGIPMLAAAMRELGGRRDGGPARFRNGGEPWWGDVQSFDLASGRSLKVAVIVPESDLLVDLRGVRMWIVLVTLTVLGLALAHAVWLAGRFSRPVEALVQETDRIGRGDLEPGVPVVSSVTEIRRLAAAQDQMRRALRTLFKMERDLRVARVIQRSTLPDTVPALRGLEVDAWNEPAEATGGDTYDVIGLGDGDRVTTDRAERAVLLLADASGHGVGPALSVTQVRAMLRMAVRAGLELPVIVRRMNAQLTADLRDGHFITAWFGLLDARDGTLLSVSCGQAPILHWVAAEARGVLLGADAPPLGIDDELDVSGAPRLALGPGDVVAVLSDGLFEARNAAREQFGAERVLDVLRANHQESAPKILLALRAALDEFTAGTPAGDDRTAVIVKRTG